MWELICVLAVCGIIQCYVIFKLMQALEKASAKNDELTDKVMAKSLGEVSHHIFTKSNAEVSKKLAEKETNKGREGDDEIPKYEDIS